PQFFWKSAWMLAHPPHRRDVAVRPAHGEHTARSLRRSALRPRFAPGPFSFENCCHRSLRRGGGNAVDCSGLAGAGARQPSKKLAQVVIGDERAASELARHEMSIADCGIDAVAAEALSHPMTSTAA